MGKVSSGAEYLKKWPNGTKHIKLGPDSYYPTVTARQLVKDENFIMACLKVEEQSGIPCKPSIRRVRDWRRRIGRFSHYHAD